MTFARILPRYFKRVSTPMTSAISPVLMIAHILCWIQTLVLVPQHTSTVCWTFSPAFPELVSLSSPTLELLLGEREHLFSHLSCQATIDKSFETLPIDTLLLIHSYYNTGIAIEEKKISLMRKQSGYYNCNGLIWINDLDVIRAIT